MFTDQYVKELINELYALKEERKILSRTVGRLRSEVDTSEARERNLDQELRSLRRKYDTLKAEYDSR